MVEHPSWPSRPPPPIDRRADERPSCLGGRLPAELLGQTTGAWPFCETIPPSLIRRAHRFNAHYLGPLRIYLVYHDPVAGGLEKGGGGSEPLSLTAKELASPLASLFSRWWSCLSLPARQPPAVCLRRRRERERGRESGKRTIDISGCGTDGGREVSGHRADWVLLCLLSAQVSRSGAREERPRVCVVSAVY